MELAEFLDAMRSQAEVTANSEVHLKMHELSQQALRITAEINGAYHTPQELRALMQELTNGGCGEDLSLFPPFYTDCGKNTRIGRGVFINAGCQFQDQGGVTISDYALIGPKTVIATLNHDLQPEKRANLHPLPVHIGSRVWIGANCTILPGVTIGDGAVVAAGAVVTKDVAPNTVVAGVPAKCIRTIETVPKEDAS
ncbi:MAG: sugar O-acetyltransferase [Clostridia bacterium]|nr:sugar O-acetyltransferase [Clostridia bacterium]